MQSDYNRHSYNKLTPEEQTVIVHKGTEKPSSRTTLTTYAIRNTNYEIQDTRYKFGQLKAKL